MKNRERNYYRKQRIRHIKRKKRIIKELNNYWLYEHEGVLSKGKIHCSCKLCSAKSNRNGWKPSDILKIEKFNHDIKEYYREGAM